LTWKIYNEVALVEKRCNHCGEIIDTFGPGTPLAQYLYLDLGLRSDSDTSNLQFGLEPYHWHNTPQRNCLDPVSSTKLTAIEKYKKDAETRTAPEVDAVVWSRQIIPPPLPRPPTPTTPPTRPVWSPTTSTTEPEDKKQYAPYREKTPYPHHLRRHPGTRGRPPKIHSVILKEEEEEEQKKQDEPKDSV
jgi:hypothetical protein